MTRFVAALLVARGPAVKAQLDPRIPGAGDLGPSRSAALLILAHRKGRARRAADDALLAEMAAAMREVPGEHLARDAAGKRGGSASSEEGDSDRHSVDR